MWLEEFYSNYSKAADRYHKCNLNPSKVESELSWMKGGSLKIGSALNALYDSQHWKYEKWWPTPNPSYDNTEISIPKDLTGEDRQREIVKSLHDKLKNIECLSIILRFLYPEQFGIISFPVTSLLNLPQEMSAVDYYLAYLRNLREVKKLYTGSLLKNVAAVDMALWSASQFAAHYAELGSDLKPLKMATEEMWRDEGFLNICFGNLFIGIRSHWKQENRLYLIFARSFLERDHRIASVITAKVYESILIEIEKTHPKIRRVHENGQSKIGALISAIEQSGIPRELGVNSSVFKDCWKRRIQAVHDAPGPISRCDSERFQSDVSKLLHAWQRGKL